MKLEMQGSQTVTSGKGGASFGAKIGAKSFWLLSSGIYSRKVLAVIREVSCNAQDAHIMSGQPQRPIEVWLPSPEKPIFQVRDYGNGLSEEEVFSLYTTYFESGKDSGDYTSGLFKSDGPIDIEKADAATGGFGLGSKSPFALTDQFTVTSVHGGKKSIYSCAVNHERVPETVKLWEGPADPDWPSGVMVTVPVPVSTVDEFSSEAHSAFRAFDVKPVFMGNSGFVLQDEPETLVQLGPLRVLKRTEVSGKAQQPQLIVVRMARVDYPLDVSALNLTGPLRSFIQALERSGHHLVLEMPSGAIIPAPSREHLQYYKGAVSAITEKLNQAMAAYLEGVLSHFADRTRPRMQELLEAREWMFPWMPLATYWSERLAQDAPIGAVLKTLGLPDSACGVLLTGGMAAPAVDYPNAEIYVYRSNPSVSRGFTCSKVEHGKVPRGRDRVRLVVVDVPEVLFAEGGRDDERVRALMDSRIAKGFGVPPVFLLKPAPNAKLAPGVLRDFAASYAAELLTEPKSSRLLPLPAAATGGSNARSPRQTGSQKLMTAEVDAFVLDANTLRYNLRRTQYESIASKRHIVLRTEGRRSRHGLLVSEVANLNLALDWLSGSAQALAEVLPEAIVRVAGSGSASEKLVLAHAPGPYSIQDGVARVLEASVGGSGVSATVIAGGTRDTLNRMITIAGTTRDKVLEMLPQRTQPSPLLETLIMDLKVSNELKMRLHGALSLARILQLRWDGKPQLHERYLNSLVPGIHPTSVAKLDLFLDLVRVHEELWLKHYAQGKQS